MTRTRLFYWFLPLFLFLISNLLLEYENLDIELADAIFSWEGYHWFLRNFWITNNLIHSGGRALVGLLVVLVLLGLASTWIFPTLRHYRPGLIYLFTVVALSLSLVSLFKHITHINCPWDLQRYGGNYPYHPLYDAIFSTSGGSCFPAGHASGGYAWVALYFFCVMYKYQWRRAALMFGLILGLTFGIAQQLRGAHFLSHDIWTLCICWYTSLSIYHFFFARMEPLPIEARNLPPPVHG
ncbi:phosphatase PAP2 family protein [Hahella sp. CCB-MM4]|uniref:phosphatase PAP2 family protein n=1 Tax=Hahella sp. (strain CCB-MM4) TaxID=1926491 RepID=UPI00143D451B|nr:phosphatase PAP2 family protein [Hahella sp. CCB-MM4]